MCRRPEAAGGNPVWNRRAGSASQPFRRPSNSRRHIVRITEAETLQLSDRRNPYPGQLGVVEEGALADLLLVDGNPLDDIALLADSEKNFVIIMKDGAIAKN